MAACAEQIRAGGSALYLDYENTTVELERARVRAASDAIRADEHAAEARAVAIARLAERAALRLPGMGLEEQAEVLDLLRVRVTVLGELPGGADLIPVTDGDPLAGPHLALITGGDDTPRDLEHKGSRWAGSPRATGSSPVRS